MNFYFKHRRLGAIFIEFSDSLGLSPLYSFSKWKNEFIIDLPWVRIILTSALTLKDETENIKHGNIRSCQENSRVPEGHPSVGHPCPHPEN
jgi:hypothetical protein